MKYIEACIQAAKKAGIPELLFHRETLRKQSISVFEHKPDGGTLSQETLLLVEGNVGGRCGSAFTESFHPDTIAPLIQLLLDTAAENDTPFVHRPLQQHTAPEDFSFMPLPDMRSALLSAEAHMAQTKGLTAATLSCSAGTRTIQLINEQGTCMTDHMGYYGTQIQAMAKTATDTQTAGGYRHSRTYENPQGFAAQAAAEAVAMLGAAPCPSGQYRAVLHGDVLSELLYAFVPAFFAERVQSGMSLAAGKLGQAIGAAHVTLMEDPTGLVRRSFDDEGTWAKPKAIIQGGVLETYLHNMRTATKDGLVSTGNGLRKSYRSAITTSATNLILQGGTHTREHLLREMGDGLFITDCDGIFAGANPASGDFSVISKGFRVRNGQIAEPISQITIGGNFFDLLANIALLGNDPGGTYEPLDCYVMAPSVLLEKLQVSGT